MIWPGGLYHGDFSKGKAASFFLPYPREAFDGEKVISAVKRVTIDKDVGAIFDGDAVLPVRRDDRERVFSWIVDADARVSCNIVYGKLVDECI